MRACIIAVQSSLRGVSRPHRLKARKAWAHSLISPGSTHLDDFSETNPASLPSDKSDLPSKIVEDDEKRLAERLAKVNLALRELSQKLETTKEDPQKRKLKLHLETLVARGQMIAKAYAELDNIKRITARSPSS